MQVAVRESRDVICTKTHLNAFKRTSSGCGVDMEVFEYEICKVRAFISRWRLSLLLFLLL